jgi:hypothetical protein
MNNPQTQFEWDFDYLKGIMLGEYSEDVLVGMEDGEEITQPFLVPWTTIKDILRDGLAAMKQKTRRDKMSTIIAHSHGPDGSDLRKRYQYLLLEQVWRDAACSPFEWELRPGLITDGESLKGQYRNRDTGVVIRCESSEGGHTFTLTTEGES